MTRKTRTHSKAPRRGDGSGVLLLEEFLPYRLLLLAETVSQSFSQIYAEQFGIGIPEWRVAAVLGERHQMTAKQIGEHSTMHKTKVSRAVAALERRGFVKRTPNPNDLRESFLELTKEGEAMYAQLVPQALTFSNTLMNVLEPGQKQALEDIISRLTDASRSFRPHGNSQ
ncbi:MAG: MarR family winged helix-turn-helix transcriptional regulator [Novosphingobium sp.]